MKIVYVEDEPDIHELTLLALTTIGGCDVQAFRSGVDLLSAVRDLDPPDVFMLDVMMPQMDGPTLLAALRRIPRFAQTPVIFLTAKTMPGEVREFLSMGVLHVISKPFDPMTLHESVAAALRNQSG